MSMAAQNNEKEKYLQSNKEQSIEENLKNLVGKNLVNENVKNRLFERISQDRLFASELTLSLKEIRFSEREFSASKPISNIKYHYLRSQNNNLF